MDAIAVARREAERIHRAAVAAGADPWKLFDLVRQEAARRDLDVYALSRGDSQLKGGRACPRCPSFFICGDLPDDAITVKNLETPFRS